LGREKPVENPRESPDHQPVDADGDPATGSDPAGVRGGGQGQWARHPVLNEVGGHASRAEDCQHGPSVNLALIILYVQVVLVYHEGLLGADLFVSDRGDRFRDIAEAALRDAVPLAPVRSAAESSVPKSSWMCSLARTATASARVSAEGQSPMFPSMTLSWRRGLAVSKSLDESNSMSVSSSARRSPHGLPALALSLSVRLVAWSKLRLREESGPSSSP